MTGITLAEFRDYLYNFHEIEFTYQNVRYCIQPEVINKVDYLSIWQGDDQPKSLCKIIIANETSIEKAVDAILQAKCFQGDKSFLEIEHAVHVEAIF